MSNHKKQNILFADDFGGSSLKNERKRGGQGQGAISIALAQESRLKQKRTSSGGVKPTNLLSANANNRNAIPVSNSGTMAARPLSLYLRQADEATFYSANLKIPKQ